MDTELFFLVNGHHNAYFDTFFFLVSQKNVWIPLYLALIYGVWRNYSWRGVLAVLLMVGVGMLLTDWANAHSLRPWIGRLRPSNPDNPISDMVHIVNGRRGSGCGFPSCHSANIWLLTFLMMHWLRSRLMVLTMFPVALLVCYSRVYLGFHYPGDILGGFVLAALVMLMLRWVHVRRFAFVPVQHPIHLWVPAATAAATFVCFALYALYAGLA